MKHKAGNVDTVIFACIHNAGRSQVASAFFNAQADPGKAHAISAGTEPAERVHPEVVEAMKEAGLDISSQIPQKLTLELAQGARLLVTMGCGDKCPYVPRLRKVDWALPDPKGQPLFRVREIRDDIRAKVVELVEREGWGT